MIVMQKITCHVSNPVHFVHIAVLSSLMPHLQFHHVHETLAVVYCLHVSIYEVITLLAEGQLVTWSDLAILCACFATEARFDFGC